MCFPHLLPHHRTALVLLLSISLSTCLRAADSTWQKRADQFLSIVNASYQSLYRVSSEAQWLASTDVTDAHDAASEIAGRASAAFNGNPALITEARALLQQKSHLKPITRRQLERVLLNAAEAPMTNPELVKARIAAETQQNSVLNGFAFKLDGKPITPNEIDNTLASSTNLA